MEAVILAGGLGTRLREVVPHLPKAMAPVCGRPFLEILISHLADRGFGRLVLALGYKADKIITHFGDRWHGVGITYEIERTPLGTGGALREALGRCTSDHVFVLNGDTFLDFDARRIEDQWQHDRMPLLVAAEVDDTSRYARVEVRGKWVVGFSEKGTFGRGLINAGCYVFPKAIRRNFPREAVFSLERDFLAPSVHAMPFQVSVCRGKFIDIGVPEDYERAQRELKASVEARMEK